MHEESENLVFSLNPLSKPFAPRKSSLQSKLEHVLPNLLFDDSSRSNISFDADNYSSGWFSPIEKEREFSNFVKEDISGLYVASMLSNWVIGSELETGQNMQEINVHSSRQSVSDESNFPMLMYPGELDNRQNSANSIRECLIINQMPSIIPVNKHDKFGLQGLVDSLRTSSLYRGMYKDLQKDSHQHSTVEIGSYFTVEELGFSDSLIRSIKDLYKSFESPYHVTWANPLSSYEVPEEYRVAKNIADKLPVMHHFTTDVLFFLFYCATGDIWQLKAGQELFSRGWRYNKVRQLWIARLPTIPPDRRTSKDEEGFYQVFDINLCRRVKRFLSIRYDDLDDQIQTPLTDSLYVSAHSASRRYAAFRRN